jgi:pimeloyl-ACP methyl ester carboxylesterase
MRAGTLYIPPDANDENPAPAILAHHGYINTRDTMQPVATELARRGYVVLNMDQTGHGLSEPPAFANGFGGPGALQYLRSRTFVDSENIGMVGHSMGGPSSVAAAATYQDGYRSIALVASAPRYAIGHYLPVEGSPGFPRNVGVIWDKYDEFSQLMAGSALATGVTEDPKAQALFGTDSPIEEGRLYGSIDNGTARELDIINTIHPFMTQSGAAIEQTVDWIQRTVPGGGDLAASNQVWGWHEFGSLLAYIGLFIAVFPIGGMILRHSFFQELRENQPTAMGMAGPRRVLGAAVAGAIGILTYLPLTGLGSNWGTSGLFPQQITNGIIVWALANAIIIIALFLAWHFASNKKHGATAQHYGFAWSDGKTVRWGRIGKSVLFGVGTVAVTYAIASIATWAFKVSPHFWVFTVKEMTVDDFLAFLAYVIPITVYFLAFAVLFQSQLRSPAGQRNHVGVEMLKNFLSITIPFAILLLAEYIPRLAGGTLLTADRPLWTIVAFQFIPILGIAALISTYFFRRTGRIFPGAFINGVLVTWLIVASQATQAV